VVALLLRADADPGALIQAVVAAYQGQKIDADPEIAAYALDTPLGPWGLAVSKRLLVLGNDADLAQELLSGKAGDAPIPGGQVVVADIDLPLIAKQWLPLVYRMVADARLELGADPLGSVQFSVPEGALALSQTLGATAKLSMLLQPKPPALTLSRNGLAAPWSPPRELAGQLRALQPEGDLAVAVDAMFSVFADQAATPESFATVMRQGDGWHVCEDDRRGRKLPLSQQQLATRLAGLKRVIGPEPDKLRVLAPPLRPSIDRRWLPDLAVVLRHLPTYHLEATLAADGIHAQERGLPLGTVAAALGVIDMALFEQPRLLQYHLRASVHPPATPPAKPGVVEF
jgi:hypothetical protein